MEPQRPPHQRFVRPPSYAGPPPQDSRNNPAPPPARPYGHASSSSHVPSGRSQPSYDPFRRAANEMQQTRPPPLGYPITQQHHQKPQSPVPFHHPHNESSSAFHSRQSSHDSMKQHSDGGVKEYNTMYREGRMSSLISSCFMVQKFFPLLLALSHPAVNGGELFQDQPLWLLIC